jgi:hypothetical protein
MNASETDSVLAIVDGEERWLTQARAAIRGDGAFVGGKGAGVGGAPEYWPRAYIYDPVRGGWQTGLVSADAARYVHRDDSH